MSRSSSVARVAAALVTLVAVATAIAQPAPRPRFGFGAPATAAEIAGWDIDVRPDGRGLPDGRGTVAEGQLVYDAKCASCHGTFGESTDYMPIAGGIGTLGSDQPIRTTGSKLNHATTLWDYINRAMPFGAPKTLTASEVYALTAYVLHLNDILPADASLDRTSIVAVRMPNRDGFTVEHGLMARAGRPDTANVACMKDCVRDVRLSSQIPDYARGDHGELADQSRPLGPVNGKADRGATAPAAKVDGAAALARTSGCTACHGATQKVVGPAFRDIGSRYGGDRTAADRLAARIREGGSGAWGAVPMPPQPQLTESDAKALVRWILAGAK